MEVVVSAHLAMWASLLLALVALNVTSARKASRPTPSVRVAAMTALQAVSRVKTEHRVVSSALLASLQPDLEVYFVTIVQLAGLLLTSLGNLCLAWLHASHARPASKLLKREHSDVMCALRAGFQMPTTLLAASHAPLDERNRSKASPVVMCVNPHPVDPCLFLMELIVIALLESSRRTELKATGAPFRSRGVSLVSTAQLEQAATPGMLPKEI